MILYKAGLGRACSPRLRSVFCFLFNTTCMPTPQISYDEFVKWWATNETARVCPRRPRRPTPRSSTKGTGFSSGPPSSAASCRRRQRLSGAGAILFATRTAASPLRPPVAALLNVQYVVAGAMRRTPSNNMLPEPQAPASALQPALYSRRAGGAAIGASAPLRLHCGWKAVPSY